jgi:hypothetical protein
MVIELNNKSKKIIKKAVSLISNGFLFELIKNYSLISFLVIKPILTK